MKELQSKDPAALNNFLRMQLQSEELLAKVTPIIEKRDIRMRESISPHERLAITLRFLASGMYVVCMLYVCCMYVGFCFVLRTYLAYLKS